MPKLGLPFEYQIMPEFFDAYNISTEMDDKNNIIENILKKNKVHTVLDLTCGTGSQVFYLAERGYKVVGVDFSSPLIKIAKKRARSLHADIKFIDGDMRTVKVGEFNGVITIANAVGHLTKKGFHKAMANINRNLKTGGIYVFDILNLEAMNDEAIANLGWHIQKKVGNTHIHGIQCSTLDRKAGVLTSYDHIVIQKNAKKPQFKKYKFSLQLYTAKKLQKMLAKHGFEIIAQTSFDGSPFIENKTLSMVMVAKKNA